MAKVLMLPGDGIGPEVVHAAHRVIQTLNQNHSAKIECEFAEIGGASIDACGEPYSSSCNALALAADAILLGAVGGPKWDSLPATQRPERGLLAIRSQLELFANLRPALVYPSLVDASSLKPELVSGLDILIVRELTGGIYFGEPRGQIKNNSTNSREAFNTDRYSEMEIERIAHVAFQFAQKRSGKKVCSIDKANVLEVSQLWREVVENVAKEYPEIELSHMYVDNAAMQLVKQPKQFD
ncbi:MAG: isocitrate/isopropylmalate family dehydrogenase, partial [Pseudomonadota bacterium]